MIHALSHALPLSINNVENSIRFYWTIVLPVPTFFLLHEYWVAIMKDTFAVTNKYDSLDVSEWLFLWGCAPDKPKLLAICNIPTPCEADELCYMDSSLSDFIKS